MVYIKYYKSDYFCIFPRHVLFKSSPLFIKRQTFSDSNILESNKSEINEKIFKAISQSESDSDIDEDESDHKEKLIKMHKKSKIIYYKLLF